MEKSLTLYLSIPEMSSKIVALLSQLEGYYFVHSRFSAVRKVAEVLSKKADIKVSSFSSDAQTPVGSSELLDYAIPAPESRLEFGLGWTH